MIFFPNAKINIGLYVTEKRTDSYHNIETLFYPTSLCDALEILENTESDVPLSWSSSGIQLDGKAEDNLCVKALNLLKQDYDIPPLKMHLHKAIPFGAGLGGGSADAAFALKALNEMFTLGIDTPKLIDYAAKLGADCAFFIRNIPQTATGIGDILSPCKINLKGYHLLLVKPDIHVSTPEAYRGIKPKQLAVPLNEQLRSPVEEWKGVIKNDFEESVFPNHPGIKAIKDKMYANGAEYASMTGSGAAVFGLFKNKPDVDFPQCFVWTEEIV